MSLYLENSDGVKSRPAWNENVPRQCLLADSSNQKKKSSERWIQIDEWKVELRTSWAESTRPGSLERMIHCPLGHFTRATSLERQLSTYSLSYHSHEGINVDFTEIGKFLRGGGGAGIIKWGAGPSPTPLFLSCHMISLSFRLVQAPWVPLLSYFSHYVMLCTFGGLYRQEKHYQMQSDIEWELWPKTNPFPF